MRGPLFVGIVASYVMHAAVAGAQVAPQGATVTAQGGVTAQAQFAPPQQLAPQQVVVQQPPPPGYGYGYAPGYAYGPPGAVMYGRRPSVPYEGGPIPPGARVVRRPITGLIVAGSVTFGISYLTSLMVGMLCVSARCAHTSIGWLMLPVAGPLIVMGSSQTHPEAYPVLVFDTILQAGGLAMLIAGAAAQRAMLVYDGFGSRDVRRRHARAATSWSIAPTTGPLSGSGLSFTLTTM